MSAGGKIRAALGALATGPKLQRQFEKPDHLHESGRLSEEDVSWNEPVFLVFSEPMQDIEAGLLRHFKIEKYDVGNRMIVVLGKPVAVHVFHELLAIFDDMQ